MDTYQKAIMTLMMSFFIFYSKSQVNFIPGYILNQNGDTIKGYIDYRNWSVNPSNIYFKETQEAEKKKYDPFTIKEFGIQDEKYVSAIIKVEISPFNINDLEANPELKFITDTVFLQTLFSGKKNLYYYKSFSGKEQFYIRTDTAFDLLIYKKYLKIEKSDGSRLIMENNRYLGQLTLYLNDCPEIQKKLSTLKYQKNSISNLFKSYFECTSSTAEFTKPTDKVLPKFAIIAGTTLTTISYSSSGYPHLDNSDYNNSLNPTFGIALDLLFPRNRNKWSLNNELMLTSFAVSGYGEVHISQNEYSYTSSNIANTHIRMNNMLRYKLPLKKIGIFFNIGISNGYLINYSNQMHQDLYNYSNHIEKDGNAYEDIRKWEVGGNLGAGINYKGFSFESRYEYANGNTENSYLKMSTHRIYCIFGYRF